MTKPPPAYVQLQAKHKDKKIHIHCYSFFISFTALILDQMSVMVIGRCLISGFNLQFTGVFGRFTYMWKQIDFSFQEFGLHSARQRVVLNGGLETVLERSFTCIYPASIGLSLIPRPEEPGNETSLGLGNQPNMNWYLFKKWLCVFQFFSNGGCYLFWRDTLSLGLQLLKEGKNKNS